MDWKEIGRRVFGPAAIALVVRWPARRFLSAVRKLHRIQLSPDELSSFLGRLAARCPCNLLVFGVGNDSVLWMRMNRGGNTVFLEHHEGWLRKVRERIPDLRAHLVRYGTERRQWKDLIDSRDRLAMRLPDDVEDLKWDVVLVDAPPGSHDDEPGRMKSIVAAARLVAPGGEVFVHDCHREVEATFCDRFLRSERFVGQTQRLRHYRFDGPNAS